MLVFVDESGDPGIKKLDSGSTAYFTVCAVVFEDNRVAELCSRRIDSLRKELGFPPAREFHFSKCNAAQRGFFLEQIRGYEFFYSAFVLNKTLLKQDSGFQYKDTLYKITVRFLFQNLKPLLKEATVCFDKCGGREFQDSLKTYLRKRIRSLDGKSPFCRLKSENSHSNNLLQLADMVSGAINRSFQKGKKDKEKYRGLILHREKQVRIWP